MVSILIPVYNQDVTFLVKQLKAEISAGGIKAEILLFDDGSTSNDYLKNEQLHDGKVVFYNALKRNVGRSKIRNLLAGAAQHDCLIFLDCDSELYNDNFLKKYLKAFKNSDVVCGGRIHKEKPSYSKKILRWTVGVEREEIDQELRNKKPYATFFTNNFGVKKSVLEKVKFNETITDYGHEDTVFAKDLKNANVQILHIENPVFHVGLEDAEVFLNQTEKAIENLIYLNRKGILEIEDVKLLRAKQKIDKIGLGVLILLFGNIFKPTIMKQLKSAKPNLKLFDFYKVYLLLKSASTSR